MRATDRKYWSEIAVFRRPRMPMRCCAVVTTTFLCTGSHPCQVALHYVLAARSYSQHVPYYHSLSSILIFSYQQLLHLVLAAPRPTDSLLHGRAATETWLTTTIKDRATLRTRGGLEHSRQHAATGLGPTHPTLSAFLSAFWWARGVTAGRDRGARAEPAPALCLLGGSGVSGELCRRPRPRTWTRIQARSENEIGEGARPRRRMVARL